MSKLTYLFLGGMTKTALTNPVSEAGRFGKQHQTAWRDHLRVGYGWRGGVYPKLHNGMYSPAIVVRQAFMTLEENLRPQCVYIPVGDLTGNRNDFDKGNLDCVVKEEARDLPFEYPDVFIDKESKEVSTKAVEDQIVECLFKTKQDSHETVLIAECVPGGTTTANAMLSLIYGGWFGFEGSSKSHAIQQVRTKAITSLLRQVEGVGSGILFNSMYQIADDFQARLSRALASSVDYYVKNSVHFKRIILAGGVQMVAVVAMLERLMSKVSFDLLLQNIEIHTTPAIAEKIKDNKELPAWLRNKVKAYPKHFDFKTSALEGLRKHNDGQNGEGCGMGAVLKYCIDMSLEPKTFMKQLETQFQIDGLL